MRTFIVSAAHGLVGASQMLEPYNRRLGRKAERAQWGRRIVAQLSAAGVGEFEDLFVLAGEDYAGPIRAALRDMNWTGAMYEPLHGKQVGERLAFLNAELAAMPKQLPAPGGDAVSRAQAVWLTPRPEKQCVCTCRTCNECCVPRDALACSFCGASEHAVRRMISGPSGAFICDRCVELCVDIIDAQEAA